MSVLKYREIAGLVKTRVESVFPNCVYGLVPDTETYKFKLNESKVKYPERAAGPLVVVTSSGGEFVDGGLTRRVHFRLILIDRLNGKGDERVTEAWGRYDTLQELFPAMGIKLGGVFFQPEYFRVAEADEDRAVSCLGIAASENGNS